MVYQQVALINAPDVKAQLDALVCFIHHSSFCHLSGVFLFFFFVD
jgi:hypothetical protein